MVRFDWVIVTLGLALLVGCNDDGAGAEPSETGDETGDGDGDPGDGDGDPGDGDGDPGDGDGDPGDGDGDPGDGDGDPGDGDGDPGDGDGDGDGDGSCTDTTTFEAGQAPTNEIHVATDGGDGADCGSLLSPCGSIEYAANLATAGTAVIIHAGTYAGGGWIEGLAGTANAPIWIGGADGEARPVIDGSGQAFQLSELRYVIIHDLEITNSSDNGINADDGANYDDVDAARYVVFRDLYIHDIGDGGNQDCLKLSGLHDFWVIDSEFAHCGGSGAGSAIDHVGCHDGMIARNHFHDLDGGGNAVQCKGGSADIEIRANRFEDTGERGVNLGGSTDIEFFRPPLDPNGPNAEARRIRVIANTFQGGVTAVAFVGCVDCLVANNVIDTPENWVFRILQETVTSNEFEFLPAGDSQFINNIVLFDGQIGVAVNVGDDTDPDSFTLSNNLWYRTDDPGQSQPPGELPGVVSGSIVGEDPGFADLAGGDYHIDPSSPAYAAGTPADVGDDFDGECFADPPSIGADEPL